MIAAIAMGALALGAAAMLGTAAAVRSVLGHRRAATGGSPRSGRPYALDTTCPQPVDRS